MLETSVEIPPIKVRIYELALIKAYIPPMQTNLENIKADDLVEYQGELWRVDDIQKSKAKIQNTLYAYDRNCSHFWYLSLRK